MSLSIKNLSMNYDSIYLSSNNKNNIVTLTITLTVNDERITDIKDGVLQLSEYNNDDSWIKGYSYGTYSFENNKYFQSITITSIINNDPNTILYSIPGNVIVNGRETIYTWKKYYSYNNYQYGSTNETFSVILDDESNDTIIKDISIEINKVDDIAPDIISFTSNINNIVLDRQHMTAEIFLFAKVTDNALINSVNIPNATLINQDGINYSWSKQYNYNTSNYGTMNDNIILTAIDFNGNIRQQNIVISIKKVDEDAPSILSYSSNYKNVNLTENHQSEEVIISAEINDNVGVVEYDIPGATFIGIIDGVYTWKQLFAYSNYSYGKQNEELVLTVKDLENNITVASLLVTINVIEINYVTNSSMYYIEVTANINNNIIYDAENNIWGLIGGNISHTNSEYNINYYLPSNTIKLSGGNIDVNDYNGNLLDTFTLELNINADKNGKMSCSSNIIGNDITCVIEDDNKLAQSIYMSYTDIPIIDKNSPDVLSKTINKNDIRQEYSSQITTLEEMYSQNILESWNIYIKNIPISNNNIITQYATDNNKRDKNIFSNGEQVIIETAYPYFVEIKNLDGNNVSLISNTNIHAIITHHDNAPTFS